jgi:hypothetical protein
MGLTRSTQNDLFKRANLRKKCRGCEINFLLFSGMTFFPQKNKTEGSRQPIFEAGFSQTAVTETYINSYAVKVSCT